LASQLSRKTKPASSSKSGHRFVFMLRIEMIEIRLKYRITGYNLAERR